MNLNKMESSAPESDATSGDLGGTIYPFPVQMTESSHFAVRNVFADKATLTINGTLLAVLHPKYSLRPEHPAEYYLVEPPTIDLDFFGGPALHGALISDLKVEIGIQTRDARIPTLMVCPAAKNITWNDCAQMHCESVRVSNGGAELHDKILVYLPGCVGYKRGSM